MKPANGRYGVWGGKTVGAPEDPTRCVEEVCSNDRAMLHYQCNRKRGYGPGGEWCKQHDPERVTSQEKERAAARRQEKVEDEAREQTALALIQRLGAGQPASVTLQRSPFFMYTGGVVLTQAEAEALAQQLEQGTSKALEALQAVEWVGKFSHEYCPWCANPKQVGHQSDCLRQRALPLERTHDH